MRKTAAMLSALCFFFLSLPAQDKLSPIDVFNLEFISSPSISPDGSKILYVRNFKDIMTDRNLSNIWMVNFDGTMNRPLTTGHQNDRNPCWSHDMKKVIYHSNRDGKTQLYLRWMDTGQEMQLTNLQTSPGNVVWSPDDRYLAFSMFVPGSRTSPITMPSRPDGAKWNKPPVYIDDLNYRIDGVGYLPEGTHQLYLLPVEGGTPRRITHDQEDYSSPVWGPEGEYLYFSANLHKNAETDPRNSEIYRIRISDRHIDTLTQRHGPDRNPVISPDGKKIAYLGNNENYEGYQLTRLYVMNIDGSGPRLVSGGLDRDVSNIQWDAGSEGLYFQYDDRGNTRIAHMDLQGEVKNLTENVGGMSLGRPYGAGTFSVAQNGHYAYTHSEPDHPADLAAGVSGKDHRITRVNEDLFSHRKPGNVEEIWYQSSYDGRDIQGWIVTPPDFDPSKKYPLILEIHGGPFSNYGWRFSAEIQLYASAGYVVLYTNPRGSTSYGKEFGNLIHHNYPGQDYDDLISGVDAVTDQGYIDEDRLYVTGGSGGGCLSAWIIGHTDRFRAAVVAKPVINWYSFVLYADSPAFFYKYWMPGLPWEHLDHYMKRSPISYAGNITTPTMLLTGEEDFRTPIAESEQLYTAIKLNGTDAAMVRIPGASHGITSRPSNLIAKVQSVLSWFEKYQ